MEGKLSPEDVYDLFTKNNLKNGNVEAIQNPDCSTSRNTVHDLPPDVLMEIFSWFSIRELCRNIAPVCKNWHLISKQQRVWKHLSFEGQSVTTESICSLLSHATQLQSLQIVDRKDANAVLRQVAVSNQSLQILIVKRCSGSLQKEQIYAEVLIKLIKSCSKLVQITIKCTEFYSDDFFEMLSLDLPDLKRINFNYIDYISSISFNRIAYICKPLEEVRIMSSENNISDNDIIELCTRMKSSLKVLKVWAMVITNNAMKSVAHCSCLHTLHIPCAVQLSDDGILLLSTLHNLSSLKITKACEVSSRGWHQLFIRSNWNSMRKLNLGFCKNVDDKVLESIGGTCPNLQNLSLFFSTQFTNEGMSEIIKGCNHLTLLVISYTQGSVIKCFPLIPTYAPNLRKLIYFTDEQTLVCEDDGRILSDLQKELPNLKICTSILF